VVVVVAVQTELVVHLEESVVVVLQALVEQIRELVVLPLLVAVVVVALHKVLDFQPLDLMVDQE
jgi:hypothetical protein